MKRLDGLDATPVRDPDWESPHWNSWRSYLHCLKSAALTGTHVLVIQDDTLPCLNFGKAAPVVLSARPNGIVCFYVGGGAVGLPVVHAGNACRHWTTLAKNLWLPLVATAFPVQTVQQLLVWAAVDSYAQRARGDDAVLGRFARAHHLPIWATVPNLVQHPDTVPSLIRRTAAAGRDKHRVAACFIGNHDPMSIDWRT